MQGVDHDLGSKWVPLPSAIIVVASSTDIAGR